MSHLLWAAAVLAALAVIALIVTRPPAASAAPRLGAAVELLTLAATGLMPPLLLACAAAAWGTASGVPGHMAAGICVLASGPTGAAQLVLYGFAVALAASTCWTAARALSAARRAGLRGPALAAAAPRRLPGGATAWIIPSGQPAAFCAGLRRPRAVITTGLLDLLGPAEQEAVLRHETAHIRLGHPRILLLGTAVARSYWWLPPARLAWTRLRRDLEAAADDEAAAATGTGPLLSALAKVALAQAPPGTARFADPGDLRYRIARLQSPRRRSARAALALGLAGAVLTAGLAASACQVLHAATPWSSLAPCLAGFGYLGCRPAWARGRAPHPRSPAGPHILPGAGRPHSFWRSES